ncbi:GGDEF domain-containing protein [Devosia oryziradicis]|uniref:diguanylate cyclase n=1 Tax=Devosia oryziradicis TaxID=2801335 RepID=A0ABX7BWB4_9HYPH|nr:GGDEF domain-containing protein [Devosia oryziradicis]QQR35354.1 GGDEF domain-containing protein [Devosia oryziradicis]
MSDFDLFADDTGDAEAATLTQQTLVDTQQNLGKMLDLMPIGLLIHTEQGVVFANRQACSFLQTDATQLRGQHLLDFASPEDLGAISQALQMTFSDPQATFDIECAIMRPDNTSRLMKVITSSLPWPGTPVIQVLMQDITDQKRAEVSLRQMTITDELTGSYNRRHATYEAGLYLDAAAAGGMPLSVVMVDIDHFKHVNDTYGHDAGDLVLKALARLAHEFLATNTKLNSPLFARFGGEEFLFLLPGASEQAGFALANSFRQRVERLNVALPQTKLKITISAGTAGWREGDTLDTMLKRADTALYAAKAGGRNRVCRSD